MWNLGEGEEHRVEIVNGEGPLIDRRAFLKYLLGVSGGVLLQQMLPFGMVNRLGEMVWAATPSKPPSGGIYAGKSNNGRRGEIVWSELATGETFSLSGAAASIPSNPTAPMTPSAIPLPGKPPVAMPKLTVAQLKALPAPIQRVRFPLQYVAPKEGMPGSIFKTVTLLWLLEHEIISPNWVYDCTGTCMLDGHAFHCYPGHGPVSLQKAFALSCNGYFVSQAKKINFPDLLQWSKKLGFRVTDEAKALQVAKGLTVLGMNPYVLSSLESLLTVAKRYAGVMETPGNLISTESWQTLQQVMFQVGRVGTAKTLDPANQWQVALKTGTVPKKPGTGGRYESWVMGYFPKDNPKVVFSGYSPDGTSQDAVIPLLKQALETHLK